MMLPAVIPLFTAIICGPAAAGPYEDGIEALKDGRFEDARSLLLQAAEADPTNSDPRWELGWAHWTLDDFQGSVDAWTKVEAIDPQRDELQHWLAAARARLELSKIPMPKVQVETTPSEGKLRIVAAGDTMMGSDLARGPSGLPPDDGQSLWADVAGPFKEADMAFVNLEGPLSDDLESDKCNKGSTACYAFRTPTRFTRALTEAGIDVVSLANNHAHDLGPDGQLATMKALDAAGIAHAGRYGDNATYVTSSGTRIGVAAAHSGGCCLNVNDIEEVQKAIAMLDRDHDLVVFSFHGGAEGDRHRHVPGRTEVAWGEKRGDLKKLARAAIDAGADLVIGHGPHVLRAMEVYKGRLIAYSLGNFIGYRQFGGKGGYGGHTVVLDAELAANGVLLAARLHPIALDDMSIPHPDPAGTGLDHVRELSAADFPETGVKVAADGVLSW